ncbi:ferredoxin [Candidatus Poribacteria bacterium]|nr:ferredoxin [Candidatus Poribacteria bacterium]
MKVKVDRDLCTGCELCIDACPDVFEMYEDLCRAKVKVVPEDLEDDVREAAEDCPVEAIIIEE